MHARYTHTLIWDASTHLSSFCNPNPTTRVCSVSPTCSSPSRRTIKRRHTGQSRNLYMLGHLRPPPGERLIVSSPTPRDSRQMPTSSVSLCHITRFPSMVRANFSESVGCRVLRAYISRSSIEARWLHNHGRPTNDRRGLTNLECTRHQAPVNPRLPIEAISPSTTRPPSQLRAQASR